MELHVVFNYSATGSIRHALAGREATITCFSDFLNYGPINPPAPAVRRAWLTTHMGFDNPDITSDEETFWPKILAKGASRVAWVSRRRAVEYCGFLEYLRRLDDLPTQIIDTTDARHADGEFFSGTGAIPASHILASDLPGTARELDANLRTNYLGLWEKLRADNSDMRVTSGELTLLSVPMSFYDQRLLSLAGHDWRPMERIVGDLLAIEAVDDLMPFSRLYDLIDVGLLVTRESGRRHPDVKVALP